MNLNAWLAVGCGAAVGAWLRFALALILDPLLLNLPLGTLAANLIGGYLMGIMLYVVNNFQAFPLAARLLVTTGFLGGLTTFSTFSGQTVGLLLGREYGWACAMIGLHVGGSILMTVLGLYTMIWLRP